MPYRTVEIVLTDNGFQFADLPKNGDRPTEAPRTSFRSRLSGTRDRTSADKTQFPGPMGSASPADEPDSRLKLDYACIARTASSFGISTLSRSFVLKTLNGLGP